MRKLFNILTKNLRVAEGLVYVHQYNAVSWEQEVEFICGDQDLLQWQVGARLGPGVMQTPPLYIMMQARHPSIQGTTMKTILQNLPLPEGDKLQLSNSLNELKTPLLQDKTVFILTFLLGKIFSRPEAEQSSLLVLFGYKNNVCHLYAYQRVQTYRVSHNTVSTLFLSFSRVLEPVQRNF